jgi:tRNA(fMet)-specific endonuclease VapC
MDKALLDTDIFSEILKGIDQNVAVRAIAYHNTFGCYSISVITVMEIVKGFDKLKLDFGIQAAAASSSSIASHS